MVKVFIHYVGDGALRKNTKLFYLVQEVRETCVLNVVQFKTRVKTKRAITDRYSLSVKPYVRLSTPLTSQPPPECHFLLELLWLKSFPRSGSRCSTNTALFAPQPGKHLWSTSSPPFLWPSSTFISELGMFSLSPGPDWPISTLDLKARLPKFWAEWQSALSLD